MFTASDYRRFPAVEKQMEGVVQELRDDAHVSAYFSKSADMLIAVYSRSADAIALVGLDRRALEHILQAVPARYGPECPDEDDLAPVIWGKSADLVAGGVHVGKNGRTLTENLVWLLDWGGLLVHAHEHPDLATLVRLPDPHEDGMTVVFPHIGSVIGTARKAREMNTLKGSHFAGIPLR